MPRNSAAAQTFAVPGSAGVSKKYGEHQHHHADDGKVAHAERQRVDLFIRHGLFRDHQVDGVKHRCEQADDIAERGLERLVQRHQR